MKVRIKICCISSVAEAAMAVRHGASALGLVSWMPSGPGVIAEETITEIAATAPPGVATFLLTSTVEPGCHAQLREALPGIALVQVIHVTGEESVAEAVAMGQKVDALLLDSGNQRLAVKELGGTGRKHDWRISRRIVESVRVPVFLAGGLNPDNVADAINEVSPYGLDVCSGLRTHGKLDEPKVRQFFANIDGATR